MDTAGSDSEIRTEDMNGCSYEGETHPHGAEVNETERRLICLNGRWVDQDELESRGC